MLIVQNSLPYRNYRMRWIISTLIVASAVGIPNNSDFPPALNRISGKVRARHREFDLPRDCRDIETLTSSGS